MGVVMSEEISLFPIFIVLIGGAFCLAAAILLFALLVMQLRRGKGTAGKSSASEAWPVYARRLMSPSEQVLYQRLVEALPSKIVLAQVQLSRIVEVKNVPKRIVWLNKILPLSVDFVICNPDTSVFAAIELDDPTHNRNRRQEADARKNKALASAGVRLIRWHVRDIPSIESIREQLGEEPRGAHSV